MHIRNGLLALGVLALGIAPLQAQNYPNRPISFVVPFAPGGLTDVPARVLAPIMQQKLGGSIVVENKTGASGVVGAWVHDIWADRLVVSAPVARAVGWPPEAGARGVPLARFLARIHDADRVKIWLACGEHLEFLLGFLESRRFPVCLARIDDPVNEEPIE